jgi:tRNA pseudouridine38-40 synthase
MSKKSASDNRQETMRNICLTIAYDGTDFHGWQRQPDKPTVQICLEAAIGNILGSPVTLWASGRTDAGVHALDQKANFKTGKPIPCPNLVKALNDVLPSTIRVKEAREVADGFHARYDVRSKTYRYRIHQAPICSPFLSRFVYHYPYPLDRSRMARAAKLLEGAHDFTSFAAANAQTAASPEVLREPHLRAAPEVVHNRDSEALGGNDRLPAQPSESRRAIPDSGCMVRTIFSSRLFWRPRASVLSYKVCGNGFLHHMVRNIVGTLLEVGRGKLTPQDVLTILEARDRSKAGPTAPAQGLCLVKVEY